MNASPWPWHELGNFAKQFMFLKSLKPPRWHNAMEVCKINHVWESIYICPHLCLHKYRIYMISPPRMSSSSCNLLLCVNPNIWAIYLCEFVYESYDSSLELSHLYDFANRGFTLMSKFRIFSITGVFFMNPSRFFTRYESACLGLKYESTRIVLRIWVH